MAPTRPVARRTFIQGLGASLTAGCGVTSSRIKNGSETGSSEASDTGFTGGTGGPDDSDSAHDTGDTGDSADTGEPAVTLADTGPDLDPRMPRSLLNGDDVELDVDLELISGALPTEGLSYFPPDGLLKGVTTTYPTTTANVWARRKKKPINGLNVDFHDTARYDFVMVNITCVHVNVTHKII